MAIESLCEKVVHLPVGNRKEAQTEPSAADRLEYMVDMLLQLKDMAAAAARAGDIGDVLITVDG